jgi:hypothetical protein
MLFAFKENSAPPGVLTGPPKVREGPYGRPTTGSRSRGDPPTWAQVHEMPRALLLSEIASNHCIVASTL